MKKAGKEGGKKESVSLTKIETPIFKYTRYRKESNISNPKRTFDVITRVISFLLGLFSILKNHFS